MAKRIMSKKALAWVLTLAMALSLCNIGILAAGTAADPYDVGDIVYTANRQTEPRGVIPANTEWDYQRTIEATYECEKEEHQHSFFCFRGCDKEEPVTDPQAAPSRKPPRPSGSWCRKKAATASAAQVYALPTALPLT